MKSTFYGFLAAAAGLTAGIVWGGTEVGWYVTSDPLLTAFQARQESPEPLPVVGFDGEPRDFGVVEPKQEIFHDFVIRNDGQAPLILRQREGDATCKCVLGKLPEDPIPPGGSAHVRVEMALSERGEGPFRQSVGITTNDPFRRRIELALVGTVRSRLRAEPAGLVFSSVEAGVGAKSSLRVLSTTTPDLELESFDLTSPEWSEFFDVVARPLPSAELAGAQGGLELEVAAKPGLPPGPFRQTIRLRTNQHAVGEFLEIPVEGIVRGPITVVHRRWNEANGVLALGRRRPEAGVSETLDIMVRGANPEGAKLTVEKVEPPELSFELDAPEPLAGGAIVRWPGRLRLPPNLPPLDLTGGDAGPPGLIVLATGDAEQPEVRITVTLTTQD